MVSRMALAALLISATVGVGGCSVFGSSTANTASTSSADIGPEETGSLGVNAELWRATLDTLKFLPLSSADPYGGVVITDWYANPSKADERLKATVYILDTRLRADGLTVTVFKQVKAADGNWVDTSSSTQTQVDIENSILTRARQLRLSNLR